MYKRFVWILLRPRRATSRGLRQFHQTPIQIDLVLLVSFSFGAYKTYWFLASFQPFFLSGHWQAWTARGMRLCDRLQPATAAPLRRVQVSAWSESLKCSKSVRLRSATIIFYTTWPEENTGAQASLILAEHNLHPAIMHHDFIEL